MSDPSAQFEAVFKALTGNQPLSWQTRLYRDWIASDIKPVIDLPTGMGKTMVMAIWLLARVVNPSLPRRLVYVVDRRTVVDQATDLADRIVKNASKAGLDVPNISTLRGQRADNREWTRDPSHPAIIIGTVDLIGSALLFSGYRSSFKRRPLEAGLLGQDSLLVLDEAHLSKPFEKLLGAIDQFNKKCGIGAPPVQPMRVIRMSATSGKSTDSKSAFTLLFDDNGNLTGDDAKDKTIAERFGAPKTLSLVEAEKPVETIATKADRVATEKPGSRIVIFVQTPRQVADVRKVLERKNKSYATRIAQLTGTMRGLERDELVTPPVREDQHERRVMQRFLNPDNDSSQGECFLISTSAGEVGFDLNADHMVCDATTIDSLIQRLGRVNRRGLGEGDVHLIIETPKKEKDGKSKKLEGIHLAIAKTLELLTDGMSLSPQNIAHLKRTDWSVIPEEEQGKEKPKSWYDLACSPEPATVKLTDILLDAWSMTSIIEPMPGRPEVGPWLRGIAEWEPPQTTIAWRAELDLDGFADLDIDDIEEWFDTHRIVTHETLSMNTSEAATWLERRWTELPETRQRNLDKRPVIIDRGGMGIIPLGEVVTRVTRKAPDADAFLRGAEVIVPASFGGIRRGVGLLDPSEPKPDKDDAKSTPEEKASILSKLLTQIDVADARGRYREKIEKPEDGEAVSTPIDSAAVKPAKYARYAVELASDDDSTLRLVSYVPRREKPETGAKRQTLEEHVSVVRVRADAIISHLALEADDPARLALELAADWHDHGKNREFFQRTVRGTASSTQRPWPDHVVGKSGGEDRGKPARGYRHEFGSLREFTDSMKGKAGDEVFDLAMHLIATHHGRGRPHFAKGGFDPLDESGSEGIHTDAIRRFARLQRKHGWWRLAWLEDLLRCADAMASADQDTGDDPVDAEEGAE